MALVSAHVLVESHGEVHNLLRLIFGMFIRLRLFFLRLLLVVLVEIGQIGASGHVAHGHQHSWKLLGSLGVVHGHLKRLVLARLLGDLGSLILWLVLRSSGHASHRIPCWNLWLLLLRQSSCLGLTCSV